MRLHLGHDRPAYHVARRQFAAHVELAHETIPVPIDQRGPFAAHGLRDQAAAAAGNVEYGGMELHEFHVAQLGAGAVRDRQPITSRDVGVRRLAIDLPCSTGAQYGLFGPHQRVAMLIAPYQRAAAASLVGEQVQRERMFPSFDVGQTEGAIDHGPHDFLARGVAQRMHDSMMAVPAFASQSQRAGLLIEQRSPFDQFVDAARRLANHHFDHGPVAQIAAGRQGIGDMVLEPILGIEHAGNASLGVVAIRLPQAAFADHQHRLVRRHRQRRPQARQAAADDQHVGKPMRNPLGVERHQVARNVFQHQHSAVELRVRFKNRRQARPHEPRKAIGHHERIIVLCRRAGRTSPIAPRCNASRSFPAASGPLSVGFELLDVFWRRTAAARFLESS